MDVTSRLSGKTVLAICVLLYTYRKRFERILVNMDSALGTGRFHDTISGNARSGNTRRPAGARDGLKNRNAISACFGS